MEIKDKRVSAEMYTGSYEKRVYFGAEGYRYTCIYRVLYWDLYARARAVAYDFARVVENNFVVVHSTIYNCLAQWRGARS